MSGVLVVTWDGGGNVPPALGIVSELVARGHAVTVLGHGRQRTAIERAGASALAFDHSADWDPRIRRGTARFAAAYLTLFTDRGIGVDTAAAIERVRPDAILVDALLPAATSAALASGRPTVVLVHTVLAAVQDMARGPIGTVSSLKGFSMADGLAAAPLLLVTSPDALAVGPAPANAVHVGPVFGPGSVSPRQADATSTRVLVSLSTIHYAGMPRVLQGLVDAFRDLPLDAIVTTGPTIDPASLQAPSNVEVHRTIPHAEILPEVGLVIGHGGHGTATTALAAGVPVLVRAMSGLGDHVQVGAGLE
ncbi:MAG: hypothetical protein ABWY03_04290, partial [Microbacterium sp.]